MLSVFYLIMFLNVIVGIGTTPHSDIYCFIKDHCAFLHRTVSYFSKSCKFNALYKIQQKNLVPSNCVTFIIHRLLE